MTTQPGLREVLVPAGLGANTPLDGVLLGTPVTPALAPNSIVSSNITASGDYLLVGNRSENSEAFLFYDASEGVTHLYSPGGALELEAGLDLNLNDLTNVGLAGNSWTSTRMNIAVVIDMNMASPNIIMDMASGETVFEFDEGGNFVYRWRYAASGNILKLETSDSDGGGTNADVWRISDGQLSIDANTTWDDNAFDDYDDVALIAASISPTAQAYDFGKGVLRRGRDALIEVGVLRQYYLEDGSVDPTFLGYNDQRMAALLAGGLYQTRATVDRLEQKIAELEDRLDLQE